MMLKSFIMDTNARLNTIFMRLLFNGLWVSLVNLSNLDDDLSEGGVDDTINESKRQSYTRLT